MTKIKIFKNRNGSIIKYEIKGHSGYAEHGKDILCSAISTLGQTALIALNEVCGIDENSIYYNIDDTLGYLSVSILEDLSEVKRSKADVVLETMIVGFKSLEEIYSDYMTLEYGEV